MHVLSTAAQWFVPFAVLIGIWVSWNDMKFMRIPNAAVLTLALVYVVIGPLVMPFKLYLWHLAQLPMVLLVGFVMNVSGLIGAGDAKFAAAMAPFFAVGDLRVIIAMASAILLGAFFSHRMMGLIPAFRRAVPDWHSWERKDFPMGLALSGLLIFYLLLGAIYGA